MDNIRLRLMMCQSCFISSLLFAILCIAPAQLSAQQLDRFEFREPHLGTVVEITLYAPTETVATDAADAAFDRISELNRVFSDYLALSETQRLCQTAGTGMSVQVSSELFEILSRSASLSEETDGAFDVTISPVIKLWRAARKQKSLPDPRELALARELVRWKNVKLDRIARSVELTRKGMALDFGGIAKGYIAQEARSVVMKRGITRCLIAIAGDIAAGAPPLGKDGQETEGWRIGVAPLDKPDGPPSRMVRLRNMSISTSGDAFQFVEINGVRYSHIVDPKTGIGLTHRSSVTVIAPEGATSDGLATAVAILGPEQGLKLISRHKGASAFIVTAGKEGVSTTESPEFSRFVIEKETVQAK